MADNFDTVGALLRRSEADLLRTPQFGRKSYQMLRDALELHGQYVGMLA